MTTTFPLTGYGVKLSLLSEDKVEQVRLWRNHPEVANNMLDKSVISKSQQQRWFNSLNNQRQLYLVISYKEEDIGVIYALVDDGDDEKKAQPLNKANVIAPGLYIAPECQYRNSVLAFCPSLLFIDYLFQMQSCSYLKAKVFSYNTAAIRYNEALGYNKKDVDEDNLLTMTLSRENYQRAKNKLTKVLRF